MLDAFGVREENWRDAATNVPHFVISETPRFIGRAMAAFRLIRIVRIGTGNRFTDIDGSRPDGWRYMREVVDAGKPADATGYR